MIPADRNWRRGLSASPLVLGDLRGTAGAELPKEYYDLLTFSNGGEGPLSVEPGWFVLDTAEEALSNKNKRTFDEFFPGFFVIGSNGAGELIAFDLRGEKPWPIVMIDMTNIDLDESVVKIADDFPAFIETVGKD